MRCNRHELGVLVRSLTLLFLCCTVLCCLLIAFRMAPEVLLSDEYNELADVWSLGITAYELAVGEPPHAKVHSMRAAVKIPQSAPPTLPDPETWSVEFHSFLAACLVKDPARRPSAEQLLQHPFIARAAEPTVLVPMIAQRERDAGNAQRKANNVGTAGSLDSMSSLEDGAAPLSKAPQQQTQPAIQAQQHSQLQQAPGRQEQRADSSPASVTRQDNQQTQLRGDDNNNIDRTQEHWNNVDDERSDSPTPQQQQQQRSINNTRTLPHPVVLPAEIDTSPPRRLHRTGASQQQPLQQPLPARHQQSGRPHEQRHQHPQQSRPVQRSPTNGRETHPIPLNTTLRSSSSSPALSQQPSTHSIVTSLASNQRRTAHSPAAAYSPDAGQPTTSMDSSQRHFFPSLPSAAAHSLNSPLSSSPSSPTSPSSLSHKDRDNGINPALDGEWSSTPLRRADGRSGSISRVTLHMIDRELKQYERTPSWPSTGTAPT